MYVNDCFIWIFFELKQRKKNNLTKEEKKYKPKDDLDIPLFISILSCDCDFNGFLL